MEFVDERVLLARERTALSNERTFLAWIRTGLASVGGGFAIIHLLTFQNPDREFISSLLGLLLILLGMTIFLLAFFDYRRMHRKLRIQNVATQSLWVVGFVSFILVFVSFLLLLLSFRLSF